METGFWGLETEMKSGILNACIDMVKVLTSVHEPRLTQDICIRQIF